MKTIREGNKLGTKENMMANKNLYNQSRNIFKPKNQYEEEPTYKGNSFINVQWFEHTVNLNFSLIYDSLQAIVGATHY